MYLFSLKCNTQMPMKYLHQLKNEQVMRTLCTVRHSKCNILNSNDSHGNDKKNCTKQKSKTVLLQVQILYSQLDLFMLLR